MSIQDPSGASIPQAALTLTNPATGVARTNQADAKGIYRFESLAPGNYVVSASAPGFGTDNVHFTLTTDQLMNVPLALPLATAYQSVEVTTQAPVLDTAETRTQLTINQQALDTLPLPGRNQLGLITLARRHRSRHPGQRRQRAVQ